MHIKRITQAAAILLAMAAAPLVGCKTAPQREPVRPTESVNLYGVVTAADLQDQPAEELVALMGNELAWTRLSAAQALAGRDDADAAIFLERLSHHDWRVVRAAQDGLLVMLRNAKKNGRASTSPVHKAVVAALPTLEENLKHDHYYVRIGALQCLGAIGPDAAPAGDAICNSTEDEDYLGVVPAAFKTIQAVGPDNFNDDRLFEVMEKSVKSRHLAARSAAIGLIYKLDEKDQRKLIPAMLNALEHDANDGYTRYHVQARIARLLQKLEAEGTLPRIIKILEIRGWGEYHRVKQFMPILKKYGPAAKDAIPALEEYIRIFEKRKNNADLVVLVKETMAVIKGEEKEGGQDQ